LRCKDLKLSLVSGQIKTQKREAARRLSLLGFKALCAQTNHKKNLKGLHRDPFKFFISSNLSAERFK